MSSFCGTYPIRVPGAQRTVPWCGTAPMSALNSTVLPAPFGPITARALRSGTVKLRFRRILGPAEADGQPLDLERVRHEDTLRRFACRRLCVVSARDAQEGPGAPIELPAAQSIYLRPQMLIQVRMAAAARLAVLASVAAGALTIARPTRACSVCGCGDPLLTSSDPAAITGRLRLQLDMEYLRIDAGNEADPSFTDELTQWSYRLNAVYRPTDALSLTATLPVVNKAMRMVGGGTSTSTSDATGLGDVELAARYALWRGVALGIGRVQEVALSAGTSMPTGPNDLRSGGERIDEHGQPGTGSWGPFAGVHYRFEQGSWLGFASLSGRVRSENGFGYTYGSALLWSAHGQYFPTRRLALDLGLDGRYAAADKDSGETVVNTGGTVLSAAPGVYLNARGGAWLFVRGQIPFYKNFRGEQDQLPSVTTGVQYQLP